MLSTITSNRAARRASMRKAVAPPSRKHFDLMAGLRNLDHSRPYEADEMLPMHNLVRAGFERLRTGCGNTHDFDLVSMVLNMGQIRAEQIDPALVHIIERGQLAFVRMQERYRRGLNLGFDAQGLWDVPPALNAYQTIADASSPKQMLQAAHEVYRRMTGGNFLTVASGVDSL
jgi:hypothetical protein